MKHYNNINKIALLLVCMAAPTVFVAAQDAAAATEAGGANPYSTLRYVLMGVATFLAFVIIGLAYALVTSSNLYFDKLKARKKETGNIIKTVIAIIALCCTSFLANAQDAAVDTEEIAVAAGPSLPLDIKVLIGVVAFEFIIIAGIFYSLMQLLGAEKHRQIHTEGRNSRFKTFFQRINNTVAIEDEATLDLNHDYDGIRELDNKIPRWWMISFFLTIIFAIIYCYQFFVTENIPNQYTELETENIIAKKKIDAYRKKSGSGVDEKTVKMLDAAGITAGKETFIKFCGTCHGAAGQGGLGPNLTDDFWLHKGGIGDIFTSIKYGIPEKGMKSWKDDFSGEQIAELASYIKSIHGTKPAGAKEPQGELYKDEPAAMDSTATTANAAVPADSSKAAK